VERAKVLVFLIKMGKAVRLSSEFGLKKCYKTDNNSRDRISRLPDEILVIILSGLSIGEAARTSILSSRWSYLWTFFTGSMDFDGTETLLETRWKGKSLELERTRFVNRVNQVLRSHQGISVDELKVCFTLDNSWKPDIDSWIDFAIQKKIRRLELDLSNNYVRRPGTYTFPSHLLENVTLGFLTSLRLVDILVTGEVLENLLRHMPFLEEMSVISSPVLVTFTVLGPSLKLKYLEILYCYNMENLEISAENLVTFKYVGPNVGIPFKHVPCLAKVLFGGLFSMYLVKNLWSLSSYFTQLERLSMLMTTEAKFPRSIPEIGNLKHLELTLSLYNRSGLISCMSMLEASPSLHEFTLKVGLKGLSSPLDEVLARSSRDVIRRKSTKYEYLKVVKVAGRVDSAVIEFIMLVLQKAVSLEKVIVKPRRTGLEPLPYEDESEFLPLTKSARRHAKKLAAKLPPGAEFAIL